jgi:ubiquinone/menaquinone biosynthesis C-methylase UbiE
VADVGAGGGYFTFRLAARVGANGKVIAQDLSESALKNIAERAEKEKLAQIQTIHGAADDPKLPEASLDAILVVDAFHEFVQADRMTAGFALALKPGGKLGVIDRSAALSLTTVDFNRQHHIPQERVISEAGAAGLRLVSYEAAFGGPPDGDPSYLLVFEKPAR